VACRPEHARSTPAVRRYVRYGASPRALQALVPSGKIRALLDGRFNVAFEDVRAMAPPALRHRLILSFEADAEGISVDHIIADLLRNVPED
jgi:MoxR-like ATPase